MSARYTVGSYDFTARREAERFARAMVRDGDWQSATVRSASGEALVAWHRSAEGNGRGVYKVQS